MRHSPQRVAGIRIFAIYLAYQAVLFFLDGVIILGYFFLFFSMSFILATFWDSYQAKRSAKRDRQINVLAATRKSSGWRL